VANVGKSVTKYATKAGKFATSDLGSMVIELGGNWYLNNLDARKRRELDESLAAMSEAERQALAEEIAASNNQLAQTQIILDAIARAKELGLTTQTNRVRNFALILMGIGVITIGIALVLKRK